MKIQCRACKEIVSLSFRMEADGSGIQVACPECRADYFVAATDAAPRPVVPGGDHQCPKCGEAQPPAEHCRRCGLAFARWDSWQDTEDASADNESTRILFEAARARWADDAAHERLLEHCMRTGQFSYAISRYRRHLVADPTDAVAGPRMKQLQVLAEQKLLSRPEVIEEDKNPYQGSIVVLLVCVFLVLGGVMYSWIQSQAADVLEPGEPPP